MNSKIFRTLKMAHADPADCSPAVVASKTPFSTRARRALRSATSAPTTSRRVLRSRTVAAETPKCTTAARGRSAPGPTPATTRLAGSRQEAAQTAAPSPAAPIEREEGAQATPQISLPKTQLKFTTPAQLPPRVTRLSVRLSSRDSTDRGSRDPAVPSVAHSPEAHPPTEVMHQTASAGHDAAAPSPSQAAADSTPLSKAAADSTPASPQQSPARSVRSASAGKLPSITPPAEVEETEKNSAPEHVALSPVACPSRQITDAASPCDTAGTRNLSAAATASSPKPDGVVTQEVASVGPNSPADKQPSTPQTQITSKSAGDPEIHLGTASAGRLLAEQAVIDEAAADGDAGAMALMATLRHAGKCLSREPAELNML